MDFDKLNQRIAILEHRTVVDEIGNHTSKWDEVFSCWAKVSVKSSAEQVNTESPEKYSPCHSWSGRAFSFCR